PSSSGGPRGRSRLSGRGGPTAGRGRRARTAHLPGRGAPEVAARGSSQPVAGTAGRRRRSAPVQDAADGPRVSPLDGGRGWPRPGARPHPGVGRMPALLPDGTECPDGQGEALRRAFWFHIRSAWNDPGAASAGTYTVPGQPEVWCRQDPYFSDSYDVLAKDDDMRVQAEVRRRALDGEPWALSLCYRSVRGLSKAVDADRRNKYQEPKPMAPGVAAAMIRAGLRAAGAEGYSDNPPENRNPVP